MVAAKCFMGVEVADCNDVPVGMSTTRFAEGDYVIVESQGQTLPEATSGVVPAVGAIDKWLKAHGYGQGDEGIVTWTHETMGGPPFRCYLAARIVK